MLSVIPMTSSRISYIAFSVGEIGNTTPLPNVKGWEKIQHEALDIDILLQEGEGTKRVIKWLKQHLKSEA
jgi:hypothetical protein